MVLSATSRSVSGVAEQPPVIRSEPGVPDHPPTPEQTAGDHREVGVIAAENLVRPLAVERDLQPGPLSRLEDEPLATMLAVRTARPAGGLRVG